MALNLTKSFTFVPSTVIASAEVNTDFDTLYNAFSGLEATTSTLAKLKMDADPTSALEVATKQYVDAYANYRRPQLTYISATLVDVAVNTGTANTTKIVFPDGNYRSVTEDTSSSNKYRRFDITATAEFSSGTEDSGLRSGLSETTNTWYALYAVKSTINTANFVLVGDTTTAVIGNVSTLNGRYGTNGWVYLGYIRNGDNAGVTGDIIEFDMAGNVTYFRNELATGSTGMTVGTSRGGYIVAVTAAATSLAYSYSLGTGATAIPDNITHVDWSYGVLAAGAGAIHLLNSAGGYYYRRYAGGSLEQYNNIWASAAEGLQITTSGGGSTKFYISVAAFNDLLLGVGSNPFI